MSYSGAITPVIGNTYSLHSLGAPSSNTSDSVPTFDPSDIDNWLRGAAAKAKTEDPAQSGAPVPPLVIDLWRILTAAIMVDSQIPQVSPLQKNSAAKTMFDFLDQTGHEPGTVPAPSIAEMANLGTLDGQSIPANVKSAANELLKNDGDELKTLEAAEAEGAGLPSTAGMTGGGANFRAVKTIFDFKHQHGIAGFSVDNLKEMGNGTLSGAAVPAEVQEAAKRFLRDDAALFQIVALAEARGARMISP